MSDAPERICPDCGSRHYARCDERHEDGKWHPGSILRCIECKATFLDPALAASSEVQALIREAEARGMERAAGICQHQADENVNAMEAASQGGRAHNRFAHRRSEAVILRNKILAEAAAIRGEGK